MEHHFEKKIERTDLPLNNRGRFSIRNMANKMAFAEYGDIRGGQMRLQVLIDIIETRRAVQVHGAPGPTAVITCEEKVLQDMKDCVAGRLDFADPVGSGDSFSKRYQKSGNAGKILTALKVSGNETKEYKISPAGLIKTAEFGSSGGSGSGSENTDLFEGAACWVGAFRYSLNQAIQDDYRCTLADFQSVARHVETKESMEDIHQYLMDNPDWMQSSIRTANALYADVRYRNTSFHWYHGNDFVKAINAHFKDVNDREDRPFADINKWTPADIWLCDCAISSPLTTFEEYFAGWNNLLMELVNQKKLIGVSLKKVTANSARIERTNMGEERPRKNFISCGSNSLYGSMDTYFDGSGFNMQMRDTSGKGNTWQGEILGGSAFGAGAKGGKVGGGILNRILESVYGEGNGCFRNHDVDSAKRAAHGSTLDQSIYDLADRNKGVVVMGDRGNLYKHRNTSRTRVTEELTMERVQSADNKDRMHKHQWKFSKFLGLEVVDIVMSGTSQERNDVSSRLYQYAASRSDKSAPFLKVSS